MPPYAIEYSNFKGEYEAKQYVPGSRLVGTIKKGVGQQPEKERKGKGEKQGVSQHFFDCPH